ncbi:hypothetical protein EJ04DRAFT_224081 [Polyplosphaeria fusca]|uniref:Transmembrane protein n=1 Tax=Polyplosphaeria fusca TaxID=682080 RepID=A0A9P4R195_9PLEO|nr:hypothetical protein EJ04DRAFT_224081 [Polyplosphaeria fusca]
MLKMGEMQSALDGCVKRTRTLLDVTKRHDVSARHRPSAHNASSRALSVFRRFLASFPTIFMCRSLRRRDMLVLCATFALVVLAFGGSGIRRKGQAKRTGEEPPQYGRVRCSPIENE